MSFNSGKTFKEMLEGAAEVAGEHWDILEEPAEKVFDTERDALRELASEWMCSGLNDKELDTRLQQLHQRFNSAIAQEVDVEPELLERVVQKAFNIYWEALMKAL
ncbi:MAG: hypothetical protein RBR43_05790 [Desulfuromonadaceae bacterium]|nr:hypothetical protein [Desulfuromonas sp.]MDY0185373.1 hypothetical protein [Desulfuromonadaceae bacterium]